MSAIPGLSDLQLALQNAKRIDNFRAAYKIERSDIVANRDDENRLLITRALGCFTKK